MSFEQHQFHMAIRLEEMTRAERIEVDEQAGRVAYALWRLGRAIGRACCAAALRARPKVGAGRAMMQPGTSA
jgi:DNA-binding HxlR family transcriptional regulator